MGDNRLQRSVRITVIGLCVNAVLSIGKLLAGYFGHSNALVADGVESLADILSSVVVWHGVMVAAAPPDEEHPYGHGEAEPIAAAVVASLLLFAALWITAESVRQILRPHATPAPFTLIVLIAVVIIKEMLFRVVTKEGAHLDSSVVQTDAWHHRSDAITSAFAFVGISIALVGGKGWESADDWAALLAAGVIAFNGLRLLKPALNELMDTSPQMEWREQLVKIAAATPEVVRVEKCIVRKMGTQYFADMHIEVDPQMSVEAAHRVAHQVKDNIRLKYPAVRDVLVHVEPANWSG
jgi:cation diffusion facilitator family transporter